MRISKKMFCGASIAAAVAVAVAIGVCVLARQKPTRIKIIDLSQARLPSGEKIIIGGPRDQPGWKHAVSMPVGNGTLSVVWDDSSVYGRITGSEGVHAHQAPAERIVVRCHLRNPPWKGIRISLFPEEILSLREGYDPQKAACRHGDACLYELQSGTYEPLPRDTFEMSQRVAMHAQDSYWEVNFRLDWQAFGADTQAGSVTIGAYRCIAEPSNLRFVMTGTGSP